MKSLKRTSRKRSPSTEETRLEQLEPSGSIAAPSIATSPAAESRHVPDCSQAKAFLFSTTPEGKPAIRLTHPTTLKDLESLKRLVSSFPWPSRPIIDVMFRGENRVELTIDVDGFRVVTTSYAIETES